MAIEFKNGIRVTPVEHELSPLEAAIEKYAQKCRDFYCETNELSKSLSKEERESKMADALKHLEQERRFAETAVDVQSQLEQYRNSGRQLTTTQQGLTSLEAESHSPTRVLAKYMRAAGKPRPSTKHAAHHIVPGKGKTRRASQARLQLHQFGVRINDPDNGVWMVHRKKDTPHFSMPNAKGHLTIHTHNYEEWVYNNIRITHSETQVRQKLNNIRRLLEDGNTPHSISQPPTKR